MARELWAEVDDTTSRRRSSTSIAPSTMEAGIRVWAREESGDDPWILSEIVDCSGEEITLRHLVGGNAGKNFVRGVVPPDGSDEGEGVRFKGVELANAPLSRSEIEAGADNDMISLQHLHEPAILHGLSERYFRGEIYTWTGPILIAVNPFQRLPLYTKEILDSYRQQGLQLSRDDCSESSMKGALGPHVFAIADRSYRQMMSEERRSQSILISGESGAGKTETTKIVMLYLTTVGSAGRKRVAEDTKGEDEELSVMERVLQSNPILEAFGNAKTLRNDNSSRFGKFIELGFDRAGVLQGAKVQTYLLEKVRIGFHSSGERNYHIFYQLLRGATPKQRAGYRFPGGDADDGLDLANCYHMTSQGGAPQLREFSDEECWKYTLKSMQIMGWSDEKVERVMGVIAGILHLGQIEFDSEMSDGGQEVARIADEDSVANAAILLGVDVEKLITALTVRIMVTRGDEVRIDLAPNKAADARDALAKTVYGALFLWVVKEVNGCIKWACNSDICSSTGVLDIFGFESFAVNSFEQLCINFTNEALQQQFNKFIFKLEQEEYEREKIEWAFIEFPDNQDCLDAIQARPRGILAMLDDECKLGHRGNDRNWAKKMNQAYLPEKNQEVSANTRYSATKMQQVKGIFCVRHFAGKVAYTAETNFLEKNRDEIPLTAKSLFEQDSSDLIQEIYTVQREQSEGAGGKKGKSAKQKTVSQQFKEQLHGLISRIDTTDPHYIRCLKPNDQAKPNLMIRKRLTEQLRYGGVLEAIRVTRVGYPIRMDHVSFLKRYRLIAPFVPGRVLPLKFNIRDARALCVKFFDALLQRGTRQFAGVDSDGGASRAGKIRTAHGQPEPLIFTKSDLQLGLTKVFMKKGAHGRLESHRLFHRNAAVILIQTWTRMKQRKARYRVILSAALTAERWYRGCLGRARWKRLHKAQTWASLLLTNNFRMQMTRRRYDTARRGMLCLQALYRLRTGLKYVAQELAPEGKENVQNLANGTHSSKMGLKSRRKHRGKSSNAIPACEGITPALWTQEREKLSRLADLLDLVTKEQQSFFRAEEQAAEAAKERAKEPAEATAAADKRRKRRLWGVRVLILILVSIATTLGVLLISRDMSGEPADSNTSNLRGYVDPSSTATASLSPSMNPTGVLFCPPGAKAFELTIKFGQNPPDLSWAIVDSCTLQTYSSCFECYSDGLPNFSTFMRGCLPNTRGSEGESIEFVLEVTDSARGNRRSVDSERYEYELRYDGEVVVEFETSRSGGVLSNNVQRTHFGKGGECSESPSLSPSASSGPTTSGVPTDSPTITAIPSLRPSLHPSLLPSLSPSLRPSLRSLRPSLRPSLLPSFGPSASSPD